MSRPKNDKYLLPEYKSQLQLNRATNRIIRLEDQLKRIKAQRNLADCRNDELRARIQEQRKLIAKLRIEIKLIKQKLRRVK